MAIVPRKSKGKIVYRVAVLYQGKQYWEPAGNDRREAERLDARRKREVSQGTYVPPQARSGGITIRAYAERFFAARKNRNADSEQTQVERHALALDWFGGLRIDDARPPHFLQLVRELRAKTKTVDGKEKRALSEKSIANILGTIRTLFGEAHFHEVIPGNPCVLPRKTLKRRGRARAPYNGREVLALLSERVDVTRRVFLWLAFFSGMREGEICGRRWRDWIRDSKPLGALLCTSQYDDQPLKGDEEEGGDTRPRVIPVHPELAATLDWWWREGWELVHGRRPTDDDFIFPSRADASTNHTKSSAYKLWRKACDEAAVTNHSLHSTRHTFTTFARRGTPRTDAVEAITHNKRGEMVDYYNHWLWTPLCEAILALSYRADADEHHPLTVVKVRRGDGSSGAPGDSGSPAAAAPGASGASAAVALAPELASCVPLAAASGDWEGFGLAIGKLPEPLPRISKQQDLGWRRRELNPIRLSHGSARKQLIQHQLGSISIPLNPAHSIWIRGLEQRRGTYAQHESARSASSSALPSLSESSIAAPTSGFSACGCFFKANDPANPTIDRGCPGVSVGNARKTFSPRAPSAKLAITFLTGTRVPRSTSSPPATFEFRSKSLRTPAILSPYHANQHSPDLAASKTRLHGRPLAGGTPRRSREASGMRWSRGTSHPLAAVASAGHSGRLEAVDVRAEVDGGRQARIARFQPTESSTWLSTPSPI